MASFPSIRIEGGLLGPDILDQAVAAELPGQKSADFGLDPKRNLTDEIAAVFADARALWGVFQNRLDRLGPNDPATTVTRDAWVIPFLGLLGYEPKFNQRAFDVDGQSFAISHRAGENEDAPPIHIVGIRQELGRLSPSGRPRLAPHSLVQEYLNRTDHAWGLVTNGATLRVLRDSTFVRRQAYLEFDLAGMLEEQRFQDFAAFYRLVHRTRLPRGMSDSGECLIEGYYQRSMAQGGRVRDHLRDGVEQCITRLANGFLAHPANEDLRRALGEKRLSADTLYRQLLRLIYRFLFLLVSEDRGLLSTNSTYRDHYGIARLRSLLDRRSAFTRDDDLWHSLRVLWSVFSDPQLSTLLDLAPLNGELFAHQTLDECSLTNRDLLTAFWHLAWYRESDTSTPRRVNYAALDVEELGSVYESLLEFHPALENLASGQPRFALVFGSDRKTTGSYYTVPELVNQLVLGALDPVIAERLKNASNAEAKERALLSLKVIDPACGSGHFLLAAARRIGKELARVRTTEEEPAPERVRESVRDVISHCIYGVDKNPLAVDLCRVALWIESHNAGKPLSFLDHRIRPGDSLVGIFDLATLSEPIPDAAYKPLAGDDKAVAREVVARNREETHGNIQAQLGLSPAEMLSRATTRSRGVDSIPDESPGDIHRKKQAYEEARRDPDWLREWQAANLWTAAFFAPLDPEADQAKRIPTTATVRDLLQRRSVDARTIGWADATAVKNQFFHWPLEFPEVFAAGGFDVVLSNPPWERVKLQEQEFFASREPHIAQARNKAKRGELIRKLPETNPELHREFVDASHSAEAISLFLRESGRYPLAGRGDINTYAVFSEFIGRVVAPTGRGGMIVPLGLVTDDTTKLLFGDLIKHARLVALTGYENEDFIFPAVDHRVTFSTVVLGGTEVHTSEARIGFFIRRFEQLRETHRFFRLSPRDFELLNPNTGNCPIFRSQADAELTKAIYRRVPVLLRDGAGDGNPWNLSFGTLFHMANDSHHFRTRDQLEAEGYRLEGNTFIGSHDRHLPLYEAKMLHQFDHRFSTYQGATQAQLNVGSLPRPSLEQKSDPAFAVMPDYWIRDEVVESALPHNPGPLHIALLVRDEDSVRSVLLFWLAGYHFAAGDAAAAEQVLFRRDRYKVTREVEKALKGYSGEAGARRLHYLFPLTDADAKKLDGLPKDPIPLAEELVQRFSPRWLLGWRDITNQGNERTTISSFCIPTAVGDTFLLIYSRRYIGDLVLALNGNLNSFASDYCARQKVGGTHMKFNVFRQLAVLPPSAYDEPFLDGTLLDFVNTRVLELVYTARDLMPLARDCGYDGPPFHWDEARRFALRSELDAAYIHAYLGPSDAWQPAPDETRQDLASLRTHFPTPRHAAEHILNSFPIVRDKDEKSHGEYRTRNNILLQYDRITAAHHQGVPFAATLDPAPSSFRAALGERFYCSEQMRHRLSRTEGLESTWVVGQVFVGTTPWAVARPLYPGAHPFALENAPLDAIFSEPAANRLRYDAFTEALSQAVMAKFEIRHFDEAERRPIGWLHILQWLSRDQECHLEGLLKWRAPSSGHESPDLSGGDDHFLVRAILAITEEAERKEIGVRKQLRVGEEKAKSAMQFAARFIGETLEQIRDELPGITIPERPAENPLFLDVVRREAEQRAASRSTKLERQLSELKIQDARDGYDLHVGRKAILENEAKQIANKLAEIQSRIERYANNPRDAPSGDGKGMDKAFLNSLKPGRAFCEIPAQIALFQCQIYLRAKMQEQPNGEEQRLEQFAEQSLAQARRLALDFQADLDSAKANLADELTHFDTAKAHLTQVETQAKALENRIRQQKEEPALWLYRAGEVVAAASRYQGLEREIVIIENKLKESQERQDTARHVSTAKRKEFATIFEALCQFVKGDEMRASLSFGKEKITSSMALLGELDSDAYKALSCILFDLTAVVARFHGLGDHPGFLLHDSPRESDMEPSLYWPIFRLAEGLEKVAGESFQYVITTTEPPPVNLQESSHLVLELDGSNEGGRLYRKHLAA